VKRLHYFNFAGVLALALLCAVQWRRDVRLNQQINRLERAGAEQTNKLASQEELTRGLSADLDEFKTALTKSQADATSSRQKALAAERQVAQLTSERDQLKSGITNWAAAVTVREERLKQAAREMDRLGADLNASIRKFNELATNYNVVVKELNELRAQTPPSVPKPAETQAPP